MFDLLMYKGLEHDTAKKVIDSDTMQNLLSEEGEEYISSLIRTARVHRYKGKPEENQKGVEIVDLGDIGLAYLVSIDTGEELVDEIVFFIPGTKRTREEIHKFRNYLAGKLGRQPGSVFPNDSISMLYELQPKRLEELEGKPQFPKEGERVTSFGEELCEFFRDDKPMEDYSSGIFI